MLQLIVNRAYLDSTSKNSAQLLSAARDLLCGGRLYIILELSYALNYIKPAATELKQEVF